MCNCCPSFSSIVRFSGEMIIANDKYHMSETSSSSYSVQMRLTVRGLTKTDMGGYKCISKNSIGDAEGNIRLYGKNNFSHNGDAWTLCKLFQSKISLGIHVKSCHLNFFLRLSSYIPAPTGTSSQLVL